jgi:hypothetical protein
VARLGLDADQDRRRVGGLHLLETRGVLERVRGDDAVVVVAGQYQSRRIPFPRLQVVIRRVGVQGFELRFVVRRAVVRGPRPPDRELRESGACPSPPRPGGPRRTGRALVRHGADE